MFLLASAGAKAETRDEAKKDLVSVLNLEGASGEKKDREIDPLPSLFVPLKEGLHAFFDLTSPSHPGLTPKDLSTDYRAVVGFHFRLK